jgi:phage terminase small subunit
MSMRRPKAVKQAEGTHRADRDYPEPELPEFDSFEPPHWVKGRKAKTEWRRIVKILHPVGVLTEADTSALGHFCNLHARMLSEDVTAAMLTQYRLFSQEFGLTPASRSRVGGGTKKPGEEDPTSKFFSGPRPVD